MSNLETATPFRTGKQLFQLAGKLSRKDWLRRLDIYRYQEYVGVLQRIQARPGASVLDVGSANSVLPVYLARLGYRVLAVDIDRRRLAEQDERLPRLAGRLFSPGALRFEYQDVTALTLADQSFDLVTAISMIEHIPGDGDRAAMREMARVVKPGGQLLLTVPYGPAYYSGRPPQSTAATQRVYDDTALTGRLTQSSALNEAERWYIINRGFGFERKVWRRIPIQFHLVTGWTAVGLICAQLFFRNSSRLDGRSASAAGLSLSKT